MDLDLVFLGTAGSMPTAQRAPTALLLRRGGERLLFDCGEGTQRQLLRSYVGLVELREIFMTHYHADHYLGLPGMLKTFSLRGRELPITIYGPPGCASCSRRCGGSSASSPSGWSSRSWTRATCSSAASTRSSRSGSSTPSRRSATRWSSTRGRAASTSTPPTRSASPSGRSAGLLQPGESITLPDGRVVTPDEVLGPPRPGPEVVSAATPRRPRPFEAARGAEVLVHEATFSGGARARAGDRHATALEAAELARDADVGLLALTHLSTRYFGPEVAREARAIFPETVVPKDFDVIEVPFQERGAPRWSRAAWCSRARRSSPSPRPRPSRELAGQVALAEDVTEAEEIEAILRERRDRARARERGRPPSARGRRRR